jgi:hypothetical protein
MIYLYYLIIAATFYLLIQSYLNYRSEKIDNEIKNKILFTSFKYKK